MGYGRKIATTILILLPGEKRWRRVYCVCFSNSGSVYIIRNGEAYYLREYELEEALEPQRQLDLASKERNQAQCAL